MAHRLLLLPSAVVLVATLSTAAPGPAASSFPAVTPTAGRAELMAKLELLRGVWKGPASGSSHDGKQYHITQVERVGPLLGGDVLVIEGRGFRPDGVTAFNALGVASYQAQTQKYELRSYAQGYSGTYELTVTADGFRWEVPAGPGTTMRFTATIKNGHWKEVGELLVPGRPAVQTFEMDLTRTGDTAWPLDTPETPAPRK